MPVVRRTVRAEDDLFDIWLCVAHDNPDTAALVLEDLERRCALLAGNPHMGPARLDIAPDVDCFPVGKYLIPERFLHDGIDLVRVVHGARRLESLMM